MRHGIVGIKFQSASQDLDRFGHPPTLRQFECVVDQLVELRGLRVDRFEASIRRHVYELRNIDRAIRRSGVVHNDCRSVVAAGVDVRQHQARKGPTGLRRKRKPVPVGRKRVPGIH